MTPDKRRERTENQRELRRQREFRRFWEGAAPEGYELFSYEALNSASYRTVGVKKPMVYMDFVTADYIHKLKERIEELEKVECSS